MVCGVEGCKNKYHAKGYCSFHYERNKVHGDPLITLHKTVCELEGCERKHYGKGLCEMHYARNVRHGNPFVILFRDVCKIKGCGKKHKANGLCSNHYALEYHQIPRISARNRARRKAREFYKDQKFECTIHECNNKKVELHHTDYSDPLNVVPLCQKHHRKLHMVLRRSKFKEAI